MITVEKADYLHLDAGESAFFARETEYVMTRTYDAKPPALKAFSLIPFSSEMGLGATELTFRRYAEAGEAKIIADYAKDFPRADVWGEEFTVRVKDIGASYGYNIREIRASQTARKGLDQRRALAARRAIERKLNRMAFLSNPDERTFGLLDFPGVTETTLPATGAGGSKSWAAKTVDQILQDINILFDAVSVPTRGAEEADTLLLPITAYRKLVNTRLGDNTITLMKYIKDNYPNIVKIEWLNELSGIGAGGTDRVMAGKFDSDHLELQVPNQFEQMPSEQHGAEFTSACMATCAGTILYYPQAFAVADGL
jgi:hypothetical protein